MPRPTRESYNNEKPALSYVALTTLAINNSPMKMCTLSEIYNYIMENYPYYKKDTSRWQNSLRHNLSFNDCFMKIPRRPDQPGKGAYWIINPFSGGMFENGSVLRRRKRFKMSKEEKEAIENELYMKSPSSPVSYNQNILSPSQKQYSFVDYTYNPPLSVANSISSLPVTEVTTENKPKKPKNKRQSFDIESLAESSDKKKENDLGKENIPPTSNTKLIIYPLETSVAPVEHLIPSGMERSSHYGLYSHYTTPAYISTTPYPPPLNFPPLHPELLRSVASLRAVESSLGSPYYKPSTADHLTQNTFAPLYLSELIDAPSAFKPAVRFSQPQHALMSHL